ncbi:MAG TPA: hypothetical protein VM841_08405 [Actinomycetota bacterium]|nr:hypothetical protein [Actinomycetota bacterium]
MYVPKRVVLLWILLFALVRPVGEAGAAGGVFIGYGQHTEGPTKVVDLPGRKLVTGPLTATFSVGPDHAVCAVGEAGGEAGAFNMLVYATEITSSRLQPNGKTWRFAGTARSVTMVGSVVVEDALTAFTAEAHDAGPGVAGDFFHITINTSLFPHTTFGKDLDGNALPLFSGDVAIWTELANGQNYS